MVDLVSEVRADSEARVDSVDRADSVDQVVSVVTVVNKKNRFLIIFYHLNSMIKYRFRVF